MIRLLFLNRFLWLQSKFCQNGLDLGRKKRCVGDQAVDDGSLDEEYGRKYREKLMVLKDI